MTNQWVLLFVLYLYSDCYYRIICNGDLAVDTENPKVQTRTNAAQKHQPKGENIAFDLIQHWPDVTCAITSK